jgi:hypothetical protein
LAGIAPAPASQGPDELGDEEGMAPNVSPEEQKQYEEFVLAGMALIYDREEGAKKAQVRPGILKLLDDDPSDLKGILKSDELEHFSPLVAIAATTVVVVVEIQKLAGDAAPSDDVVLHGGVAILEELAQIWMQANEKQLGEDDVHKALSMAADIYREVGADAGLVDENALKDQFSELVKADKAGRLADVSPELAGINKAAEMNAEQPDDQEPDQEQQQQSPEEEQAEPVDNPAEEEEEK